MQEGLAALGGYGRIFRENVALSGRVPQISVICGASRRRRLLLARAHRLRRDDRARDDVPHRPRRRARRDGRGRQRRRPRRPQGARPQRRRPLRRPVRRATRRCSCATCSTTCPPTPATARRASAPPSRTRSTRPRPVPDDERRVYDVRDVVKGIVDGGRLLEWAPRWARNIVCGFARLEGRAVGVVANQPRYLGGVLDADSGVQGRPLRAHLQRLRAAARRARGHARASCPARARSRAA